jgi:uncharacterized protein YjbI with pentapeptide repeats
MNHQPLITIDPYKFCASDSPTKERILHHYGLQRYSQLLCQLTNTPGNLECLGRFFSNPDRQKFPQLQHTNLAHLDLSHTNLIRGNFTNADLQGCNLQQADIIFGNFTRTNLTNADLSGSTLNETIWEGAIVLNCRFINTKGITPQQQHQLTDQGAIFEVDGKLVFF